MAARRDDDVVSYFPFMGLRVFKDGRIERRKGTEILPASIHPGTGVRSKDVEIDPETGVSARLYLPQIANDPHQKKLPLLIYFHGGGFCVESTFSPFYHNYLNSLVAEANIVVVSVEYRLAPEHPLPIAYNDSWAAVKWVASHSDDWLKHNADFRRVFFAGDSAGANIAHHMGIRIGSEGLSGLNLVGIALIHPYFWKNFPEGVGEFADDLWRFVCPSPSGSDHRWINPRNDPELSALACKKVLVCLAENDFLRKVGGRYYCEVLGKNGWDGEVEIVEDEGVDHVYHLEYPTCQKALALLKKVASFFNSPELVRNGNWILPDCI